VINELIERMADTVLACDRLGRLETADLLREAIAALTAERAAREQAERAHAADVGSLLRQLEQAEQERDRLRAALRGVRVVMRPWVDKAAGLKPKVTAEEWGVACDRIIAALAPQDTQR
jgi:hypothetical protein